MLNVPDMFHEFVSAVREKEKEAGGISSRKFCMWLGQYKEMSLVYDILCVDLGRKNKSVW